MIHMQHRWCWKWEALREKKFFFRGFSQSCAQSHCFARASSFTLPLFFVQPFCIFPINRLVGWCCNFLLFPALSQSHEFRLSCVGVAAGKWHFALMLLIDQPAGSSQVSTSFQQKNQTASRWSVWDWCLLERWSLESVSDWMFSWRG